MTRYSLNSSPATPNSPSKTISAMIDRARSGDREAQGLLYAEFAPVIFTLARRMLGSTALAEDALQDTFVEGIRSIDKFRDEAAVATWIRRVAINKCLSLMRSRWWVSRLDLDDADKLVGESSQQALDASVDLERLLDRLPAKARAVLWLHHAEGFTHDEIAALMGKTPSFSKSQLQRAHKNLRSHLDEDATTEGEALCANAMKPI